MCQPRIEKLARSVPISINPPSDMNVETWELQNVQEKIKMPLKKHKFLNKKISLTGVALAGPDKYTNIPIQQISSSSYSEEKDRPRRKVRPGEKSLPFFSSSLLAQKKQTSRARKLDQKRKVSSSLSSSSCCSEKKTSRVGKLNQKKSLFFCRSLFFLLRRRKQGASES